MKNHNPFLPNILKISQILICLNFIPYLSILLKIRIFSCFYGISKGNGNIFSIYARILSYFCKLKYWVELNIWSLRKVLIRKNSHKKELILKKGSVTLYLIQKKKYMKKKITGILRKDLSVKNFQAKCVGRFCVLPLNTEKGNRARRARVGGA
jgi:hypothetical protein